MDKVLVSKILFLDRDYQPVGTRVIRRPGIMVHTDRTDSKNIMAVGMGAFDDGDFDRVPHYWVAYEGDIKNFDDMHLEFSYGNHIEEVLAKHFRFISLREVGRKVERIKSLLGFKEAYRPAEFLVNRDGWIKENQTVVSLIEADENRFSLCDFLCSLSNTMDECREGIEYTRKRIKEEQTNLRHINEASSIFKGNLILGKIRVGDDDYIDYREIHKLMVCPALTNQALKIHTLKKRMNELERKRSYMQDVMSHIMALVWYA